MWKRLLIIPKTTAQLQVRGYTSLQTTSKNTETTILKKWLAAYEDFVGLTTVKSAQKHVFEVSTVCREDITS